ncbi:proline--tRNA ligase [Ectobacillus antri]|jgi:prolyl-tRNA synthetase|uniref:Proline--tRNA ligase n=1 Tax=Ectobacillus antri TaxID=2486280 RepID=A0ABT6H9B4_9BACI|nr:proline--tRNA ligase [Ectobacillus antri]MDG4658014.1 proline--tRNA ligase [Ectobacillus antri]MDG5755096.1 proline--tRNA ligase [Ectobacillus antri]
MKDQVKEITSMEEDFAQWYTDIVKKAELVDYSSVKGCMILRPYGYAIWENIQRVMDERLKEKGHENVYMPMFIPESLLQKEKDHVEGFAPEVAWVTHGGEEKLAERLCVRPTSETLFCEHFSKIVQSYNDLPKLYNQWCSVVRWEKTTRPFLRTTEFLWQEGHTVHATAEESHAETIDILNLYAWFCEEYLAIPVIKGQKTEKEKFAGAKATYTIESLMHDGKALQTATSHNFGTNFTEAFDIKYLNKNGRWEHAHQTSWGMTTRTIGAIIMVHGDNNGLVLPPKIAPTQVIIIPIAQHKEGVLEKAATLQERIAKVARVKMDAGNKSPGWKFNEYEMKGIPIRVEIGPKDIENNQAVLVRRDTKQKEIVTLDALETRITELLQDIHESMFARAKAARDEKTYVAHSMEDMQKIADEKQGFIQAMWCGELACEERLKEELGVTSRCIPFEQVQHTTSCVCCQKEAKHMVYWGKAY